MSSPVVIFGPQIQKLDNRLLSAVRQALLSRPSLRPIAEAIQSLPEVWDLLVDSFPPLCKLSGARILLRLRQWLQDEHVDLGSARDVPNVLLTPLSVIVQMVEYACTISTVLPAEVHGLCIGTLSAIVARNARSQEDVGQWAAGAIRLAMCIGAIIDLDNATAGDAVALTVRAHDANAEQVLRRELSTFPGAYISVFFDERTSTVTVSKSQSTAIMEKLTSKGLIARPLNVTGRFHSSVHYQAAEQLKKHCGTHPQLYYLQATDSTHNSSSSLNQATLHSAVSEILTKPARWSETSCNILRRIRESRSWALCIGPAASIAEQRLRQESINFKNCERLFLKELSGSTQGPFQLDYPPQAVAVIGMACRFAGADSVDEFWDVIKSGRSMAQPLPGSRFSTKRLRRDVNVEREYYGNFLSDIESFDHKFFGKSSREAASMDPQQRLLLETAYQAMQSAGHGGQSSETSTRDFGCFIGCGTQDYNDNISCHVPNAYSLLGSLRACLSGRVSHHFGWTGASITYDTACSSSMVALHSACKALQTGECSMALAGGVNTISSPNFYQNLAGASFTSPTGASKAFDAQADGYCRGEGVGLVVLKPLDAALADGDRILGVIAGTAINQNSSEMPINVPHLQSQADLFSRVTRQAGLDPAQVSVIEAHGTGTQVGDPTEAESIRRVFGGKQRTDTLSLGAVKSNIGHTEGAAGVASLIKVLLMLKHRIIPPQANFTTLNSKISPLGPDKMEICRASRDWDVPFRAACINNYGASGSNAAMIVCQPPPRRERSIAQQTQMTLYPVIVSSYSDKSLRMNCENLLHRLKAESQIADVAYTLSTSQSVEFGHRFATTTASIEDLRDQLISLGQSPEKSKPSASAYIRPVVLAFGGQTGTTVNLAPEVFESCPLLRLHLEECDRILKSLEYPSLFPTLLQGQVALDVVTHHCLLFALQYAVARCWLDSGLRVDAVVGHSFGQLTALCVAGSISLEDTIRLVAGRAALIQQYWSPENGSMIALEANAAVTDRLIHIVEHDSPLERVEIACYNGANSHVLVSSSEGVKAVEKVATSMGIWSKTLATSHGFHSRFADPVMPRLHALAETVTFQQPRIPVETCSNGQSWAIPTACLVAQHTRDPVYFKQAIDRLSEQLGPCSWVEAGSGSCVVKMVQRALYPPKSSSHFFQPLDLSKENAPNSLPAATSRLWNEGHRLQYWPFHRIRKMDYVQVDLPPYAFDKSVHWLPYVDFVESDQVCGTRTAKTKPGFCSFAGFVDSSRRTAKFHIDPTHEHYKDLVQGHAVLGYPLCPASVYLDVARRSATHLWQTVLKNESIPRSSFEGFEISAPLGLKAESNIEVLMTVIDNGTHSWKFELCSSDAGSNMLTIRHACGVITLSDPNTVFKNGNLLALERVVDHDICQRVLDDRDAASMQGNVVYSLFNGVVRYSSMYQGVKSLTSRGKEVAARVHLASTEHDDGNAGCLEPRAIDNFLQVAGLNVNFFQEALDDEVYIATCIENVQSCSLPLKTGQDSSRTWSVYSKFAKTDEREVVNDIFVFDPQTKQMLLVLMGVHFVRVSNKTLGKTLARASVSSSISGITTKPVEQSLLSSPLGLSDRKALVPARTITPASSTEDCLLSSNERSRLLKLLGDVLDAPQEKLTLKCTFDDMGVDSLMVAEILSDIRQAFDVNITAAEFQSLTTVGSLLDRVLPSASQPSNSSVEMSPVPLVTSCDETEYLDEHSMFNSMSLTPFSTISAADLSASVDHTQVLSRFKQAQGGFDILATATGFSNFYSTVYPTQLQLTTAYIVEAFEQLGCPLRSLQEGDVLPSVRVLSRHTKVLSRLHEILEEGELIANNNGKYVRTATPTNNMTSAGLHEIAQRQFPEYSRDHDLLRVTATKLADCLTGDTDAVELLFASKSSRELLEDFYANTPIFQTANKLLASFMAAVFKSYPQHQEVHILEVGAGTGGTTKYLLDQLSNCEIRFTYTFTDISTTLVAKARKRFGSAQNVRFETLDIEDRPPEHLRKHFHAVVSTNAVHATKSLEASTANILEMLRADGFLCLIELTRKQPWFDLVFGLLEGWWAFNDGRTYALADEDVWDSSLRKAGFEHVDWTDGSSEESKAIRIILGMAKKPETVPPNSPAMTYHASSVLLQGSLRTSSQYIFAFPGGFGTAATYNPLPELDGDIALFGLNSPFLRNPAAFDLHLSEVTSLYLAEIQRRQPQGPYTLMGYSVGGVLAYEAARQLIARGEKVERLILLDSACPAVIPPFPLSLIDFFDSIDRFVGTDATTDHLYSKLAPAKSANAAKKMSDPHVVATLRSLEAYTPTPIPAGREPRTTLFAARNGVDRQCKVPRPMATAMEQRVVEWVLDDRSNFGPDGFGWDRLLGVPNIEVIPIDGNHFSMMTEPFVSALGTKLRSALTTGS